MIDINDKNEDKQDLPDKVEVAATQSAALKASVVDITITKNNPTAIKNLNECLNDVKDILLDQKVDEALAFADWTKTKASLKYRSPNKIDVNPNFVYWAHLGSNVGSEQDKHRPVLIIRSHPLAPVCYAIPLTQQRLHDDKWYHVDLEVMNSTALVEHIRTLDKKRIDIPLRIKGKIVVINQNDWAKIDHAMKSFYKMKPLRP